jgi:hypothetical protein
LCVGLEVGFVYVLHPALAPTLQHSIIVIALDQESACDRICALAPFANLKENTQHNTQSNKAQSTEHACHCYPLISLTGRHSFSPESKAYPTHSGSAMHLASMHARSQDSILIVPPASAPAHRAELPVTEPCWPLVAHSLLDASGRG